MSQNGSESAATAGDPADAGTPVHPVLEQVADHVRSGGLIVLPTDTVYGIGCLASDADAVARLLAAKGRGRQMPPPVLVAGPEQLDGVVASVPATARALMDAHWPGALTIILDAAPDLGWDLGETGGTIAVRMPDHALALELLRATGPMAVTSANRTGEPPATDADGGRAAFPGRVTEAGADPAGPDSAGPHSAGEPGPADILLLDGGPTPGPVPSTIVSLAGEHALDPAFIRDGVLAREDILSVLAPLLTGPGAGDGAGPR